MKLRFLKNWPIPAIIVVVLIFFWKVFLLGQVPIPGDFIVGTYYPWLDYKWGYSVGVPVKNPVTSDVVSISYPLRILAVDQIKNGIMPLWNNSMFAGFPLLANIQVGIFSPTFILYFLLPKIWAWTGQVIIQPFLAAVFAFLFLRHLKLSKLASLFGGLVYAFSGFNIIWMEWNERTLVAAFIPLILLVLDKFVVDRRVVFAFILSILTALQFFSGYPQLVIYTLVACFVLILFRRKYLTPKVIITIVIAFTLSLLLSAVQFLPTLELLRSSQRSAEVFSKDLVYLPWQNLITFIAPDFFGNHATGNFWGMGDYTNNVGFTGVITLILATSTVSLFRRWEVKFFLVMLFLSLLLSLENPISSLIWKSGFLGSSAACNSRALILANLSLASLSAFTIDFLTKDKRKINFFPFLIFPFILSVIFIFTLFIYTNTSSIIKANYLVGMRNLVQPFIFTIFVALILIVRNVYRNISWVRYLAGFLILILAVFELFRFGWKYTPFSKIDYVFPETPVINYLESRERPTRILFGDTIPMNMWVPYGLESISGYNAAYPQRVAKYLSVSNSGDVNALTQGRYGSLELFTSKLTDISNGQYLVLKNIKIPDLYQKLIDNGELTKIFSDKSVDVYKKPSAINRIIFVTNWTVLPEENVFERLLDPRFDFQKEIVLEKQPQIFSIDGTNISSVNIVSYLSGRMLVDVTTERDGFLFMSDTWYPGWKAYVDGEGVEIFRANYAFQAIPVLKGDHKVEFIYDPVSLKVGKILSLTTLIFLVGVLIYEKRKEI